MYDLAFAQSLECSDIWLALPIEDKFKKINDFINVHSDFFEYINLKEIKSDGQLIVNFKKDISINKSGTLLLDFEELIKSEVEIGLTGWLEPIGDKNTLRNLRGIELKDYE